MVDDEPRPLTPFWRLFDSKQRRLEFRDHTAIKWNIGEMRWQLLTSKADNMGSSLFGCKNGLLGETGTLLL